MRDVGDPMGQLGGRLVVQMQSSRDNRPSFAVLGCVLFYWMSFCFEFQSAKLMTIDEFMVF